MTESQKPILKVKRLHPEAVIPKYQTLGSSGFDLHSIDDIYLNPGKTVLIDTGLSFEIPEGYELQIRPRSGMSAKTKLRVANSPGTIDSDYRGPIKIIIENIDFLNMPLNENDLPRATRINKGDRIAQAVLVKVPQAEIIEVEELSSTERGSGGFGSTGK